MTATAVSIAYSREVLIEKKIHVLECANCSIDFGIGDLFMKERRKDHATFYCPNGHRNYYPQKNTEEQAIAERDAARELAARESRRRKAAEDAAKHAEYQRRYAKGQLTKMRKRIANGVCPCCNRTFANLAEHMAGQHPDFVLPTDTTEETPA